MDSNETEPTRQKLRRSVLGYRRRDVERHLAGVDRQLTEAQEASEQLRDEPTRTAELGEHVADLIRRFEDTVAAAEEDAAARSAKVVADAEARAADIEEEARQLLIEARDLASATFAEAAKRYDAVTTARVTANLQIKEAIEQMTAAVASLDDIPLFPEVTPPVPAPGAEGGWEFGPPGTASVDHARRATPPVAPPARDTSPELDSQGARDQLAELTALLDANRPVNGSFENLVDGRGRS